MHSAHTPAVRLRQRKNAQCANPARPSQRNGRRQSLSCSIRRPAGYERTETHGNTRQWIPSTVTEQDGRNDKIHFVCDIATVKCETREDAASFVLHCGAAPVPQRGEHELFSKLFTTASLNGEGNRLKVRSSVMCCGGQDFQPPLFTGELRFRRVFLPSGSVEVFVTADLCLNVNRALNHRRAELASVGQEAVFESAAPVERGLCSNDNLAPLNLAIGEHDNARAAFFASAIHAIFCDVKRAALAAEDAGSESVQVTGNPGEFSLREVETCWDIGGAGFDAVQALADITPGLFEYGGKQGWEGNAGTVTARFSKWERLAAYAKAPNRLRFEIRHYPQNGNWPYSALTIAEMLAKLDGLRESAANKLNGVLSFLEGQPAASRTAGDWEAYAMAWGACCGVSGPATALFRILRQYGRIYGGKRIQCVQGGEELLRKAKDAGLIRQSHGAFRPVFPNAPDVALTDFDSSALIPGHNSETQPVPVCSAFPRKIRNGRERKQIPPSPPRRSAPRWRRSGMHFCTRTCGLVGSTNRERN